VIILELASWAQMSVCLTRQEGAEYLVGAPIKLKVEVEITRP
jgi:hypothetical protein